jgi:tRNA A-37 threonylcarbamoyl transferase component Bud32
MASHVLADRYRLLEPIGQGGMGTVWRAEDELLHRRVAIKEVRVARGLDPATREELLARTMREARICAGLSGHPSIVTVHDVLREGGRPWIVMELMTGRPLDRVVAEDGPLSPRRTAEIGRQLFDALRTAHRAGVLHRDVKPGNVMLLPDGRAVLSDFGIAVSDSEDRLTLTGRLPGSPGYVAPERLAENAMTPAADVWSLGATLYYAVEGRAAYDRPSTAARLNAAMAELPDTPRRAGPLRPVLNGMLQRDPDHRLGGSALDAALARVVDGTSADDATPTRLDVSGGLPVHAAASGPAAPAPASPATAPAAGGLGRRGWVRLLVSLVAGLITLILAPLLVEYLSSVLIPDEPEPQPSAQSTEADSANAVRPPVPDGYAERAGAGFRLALPEDWTHDDADGVLTAAAPDGAATVRLEPVDLADRSPLEHLEAAADARTGAPGFRTITLEEDDSPGGAAARWTYESTEDGRAAVSTAVLVRAADGRAAMALFSAPADRWEATADQRAAVLETLRPA